MSSGVLDDIVGGVSASSSGRTLDVTNSIRTRQRKRGSFVVATAPLRPKKRSDGLFPKRLSTYPTAASAGQQQSSTQEPKTPTEIAVLTDCVANHFLLACNKNNKSDDDNLMLEALVARFEKVILKKNEILYGEGNAAESLYVLYRGEVSVRSQSEDDGPTTGHDEMNEAEHNDDDDDDDDDDKYKIFGELEVMTNSVSYKATAKAVSDPCILFRLSKADFQSYFLPHHSQPKASRRSSVLQLEEETRLLQILKKSLPVELASYFFPEDDENEQETHAELWKQVLSERRIRNFRKGDVLIHKSKAVHSLVLITNGVVRATDNTAGGRSYEDLWIGEGKDRNSFGWQSVLKTMTSEDSSQPKRSMTGTILAETDGTAIVISKESFSRVFSHLGYNDGRLDVADLRLRRWKRTQLQQIMVFRDSGLDSTHVNGLLDLMHPCEYNQGDTIISHGDMIDVAMYFVREGSVKLELNHGRTTKTIERGGYFGEKNMLLDQNKSESDKKYIQRNTMTAKAASPQTRVDILYLEECAKIVNTTTLGLGKNSSINAIDDSIKWADLKRHKLIGTGSFGQVWLCSGGAGRYFALKVQAKYPLITSGDPDRLIGERNVMAGLNSPFVMRLFNSFQDDYRLYMVTSILPGGELESVIPKKGFPESTAKFYAAGILEGLTYMHRKHILHRDVKPENVLLNAKGYPVLIDLGFAKYVPEKTYTFCGSPLFMAPETILYKGQTKGVDHWSWAVLVYRLVTAKYPFYKAGMDEIALYKRISKGTFEVNGEMSVEFRMLMIAMLYPEPTKRLGSRANGWRDIFDSPWLASMDLGQLRKQVLPAPLLPPGSKSEIDPESFIHQSSEDDLFDNAVCGRIPETQQRVFESFGSQVTTPIGGL